MDRLCEGRIVVVTGAGRGIGREHALEFARQGAHVVVNDVGAEVDGSGGSIGPASEVVTAIEDVQEAIGVHAADVTGVEPAVAEGTGRGGGASPR